jgi:uncharacterized membrane protein
LGAGIMRYGGLAMAIAIGLVLRFWNLDLKPLWLDETITLLFSLGRRYDDIPREVLLPLGDLLQTLTWQPQSCGAIAQNISQQSTHPPLFFCLMHQWMGYLQRSDHSLRWQVRALSALFGVGAIAVMYILNRVAFSHKAGLWAAGLMAVSPFAVYLSQEARHYTLPMLIIAASLIPFVQIGQTFLAKVPSTRRSWLAWISLNSLGFYVHYFCLLALVGQALVLGMIAFRQKQQSQLTRIGLGVGLYALSLTPWFPFMLGHSQRPETEWLRFDGGSLLDWLGPIARLLGGCIVSVVILPVENQPLQVTVGSTVQMLVFIVCTLWVIRQTIPALLQNTRYLSGVKLLGSLLLVLWGEYLILVYGFHKDLTLAFRYNFVFYPVLCALLGVILTQLREIPQAKKYHNWAGFIIMIGLASNYFVVTDTAFRKPFEPQQIAQTLLNQSSKANLLVVKNYRTSQDVALGLSFALATDQFKKSVLEPPNKIEWGFTKVVNPTEKTLVIKEWRLDEKQRPNPFTLWRIGSLGIHKPPMPERLTLKTSENPQTKTANCLAPQPPFSAMGLTYQRYSCKAN